MRPVRRIQIDCDGRLLAGCLCGVALDGGRRQLIGRGSLTADPWIVASDAGSRRCPKRSVAAE